jgi:hypothetical protein
MANWNWTATEIVNNHITYTYPEGINPAEVMAKLENDPMFSAPCWRWRVWESLRQVVIWKIAVDDDDEEEDDEDEDEVELTFSYDDEGLRCWEHPDEGWASEEDGDHISAEFKAAIEAHPEFKGWR